MPSETPYSRFRSEMENEVIRQGKTNNLRITRKTLGSPNLDAQRVYVTVLNTGFVPIGTMLNILEIVFHKPPCEILPHLFDFQTRGERSTLRVYLSLTKIAENKVRQANWWMIMAMRRMNTPEIKTPIFFLEED